MNFVPDWARKPPSENVFIIRDDDRKGSGPPHGRKQRRGDGGRAPRRPADNRERHGRREHTPNRGPAEKREPPAPARNLASARIRFVPDDHQLSIILRKLHTTGRAYPVQEIVSLFLSHPDTCRAIVELDGKNSQTRLYQCKSCGYLHTDPACMQNHVLHTHLDQAFDAVETETEPPAGNFICICRCGLSGELLGPPNHNSYSERIHELHSTRYPHLSMEEYRKRIRTLHDPELIEQWKESRRHHTVYTLKGDSPEAEKPMSRSQACEWFLKSHAPQMISGTHRASLPVAVARKTEDPGLRHAFTAAWHRETRSPRSMTFAVRGAFRHRKIYTFRAGKGTEFATAIKPVVLPPEHAVDSIRNVLVYLHDHPGCTRKDLSEALEQENPPVSGAGESVLAPIGWLAERGHIIEFFNGTLAVPR